MTVPYYQPEKVDRVEFWQIIEPEESVREPYYQQVRLRMEGGAIDLCVILHEEILLRDSPTR